MRKPKLLLLMGLVMSIQLLQAQTTVTGKVVDSKDGTPIAGASIKAKGSNIGTTTGIDGIFKLNVSNTSKTLIISAIGYGEQEVAVSENVSVSMAPSDKSLSEVVVVGYGTKIKRDITGSISKIGAKEIGNTPVTSFENAIQGKAAGVFIEQQNGKLGQGIKVRVRGSASVTAGNEPFYVVDGVPVITSDLSSNGATTSPLADINPNDIESIDILKDASAAAIYGSRASNGVVLITTKKGKVGKTKIDFGYFTGTQKPTNRVEFMNAEEYVNYFRQAAIGAAKQDFKLGLYPTLAAATTAENTFVESRLNRYSAGNNDYQTYKVNTDWQDLAFQDAPISQYDLSLSGGNDRTTFYIAGQYLDQKGIIARNSLKRYSSRVNLENKVNSWLSAGINLSFVRTINKRVSNDNAFATPLQLVALSPITPTIDPRTGLTSGALDLATGLPNSNFPVYYNPMLSVENALYNTTINRTLGNVFGNVSLVKGLSFRTELGMDQLNQNEESYNGRLTRRNSGSTYGTGFNASNQVLSINTNNFFKYNMQFKSVHKLDATAGMSYQNYKNQGNSVSARDFPSDEFKKLASAATNTAYSSSETEYTFLGYFARANYSFNDKYLVALSGRYDASSRFGKNSRWGFFPAASVGWIASDEKFLSDIDWLSFLKLKASWGKTGNAEIGNFASRGLFSGDASYAGNPGTRATQIPNPDLKWETTASTDFGIEASVFRSRISIEADYYQRKTTDLLLNVPVPGTSGFSTQLRNVGKLQNKGYEITLNTVNINGKKFRWTSNINFSANRNKVTDLGGQVITGLNVAKEGEALGVFYAREFAGADPATGDAIYYKNTLLPDGKPDRTTTNDYNQAVDVVIGNPNPDFIYGFRNDFTYSGFELDVLLQGVHGNEIYAAGGQYMTASGSNGFDNQTRDQLAAWKNPGDITNVPEARLFYPNGVNNSSRYIYDGSYLRVKAVTLSYTLPSSITSKLRIDRAKFYVRGQNLFTVTDYPLWDPEVNADFSATNIVQGRDFYSVPQARTIVVGVNIGL
ncbi:MAG TPA: TonB-dependent receptor [Chitinophagaceae bacterium]|nr:TonB-dependent receptor [Chitinophagaceae bacterium]